MIFVLLKCLYDGDDYLLTDFYVAASERKETLVEIARNEHQDAIIYDVGDTVPDDGNYHDTRHRYRIIEDTLK